MTRRLTTYLTAVLALVIVGLHITGPPGALATDGPIDTALPDDDTIAPIPYFPASGEGPALAGSQDPHGLIPYPDEVRRYTLGTDVFAIWECAGSGTLPVTAAEFASQADVRMTEYFGSISKGRYDPDFVVGGVVPDGEDCATWAQTRSSGLINGAIFIRPDGGGFAGPGLECSRGGSCPSTYPANLREGYVGVGTESWTTLAHEMGHMLSWPHSYTRLPLPGDSDYSQYDNAIDLMSGNRRAWSSPGGGTSWGSYPEPFGTTPFNRYSAGWIDESDLVVWDGTTTVLELATASNEGTQALVVEDGSSFYILGARMTEAADPIPNIWQGVEVYKVGHCNNPGCFSLNTDVRPQPPVPFDWRSLASYSQPLPHVLGVGDSIDLVNGTVRVTAANASSFAISITGHETLFEDVSYSHVFRKEIEWLANKGITRGCNPPDNDEFCPDGFVTRGQMAAFLSRAFDYTDDGTGDLFDDDNNSIFETDIQKLATAGVTKGCNPPANTHFCPDSKVTRGQFAAFLYRALN
ncbi:MAG: S-layer homology domain-containing protein [Acidimicrobiia bacterium]